MFDLPNVAGNYTEPKCRLDPIVYVLRKRRYELGWSNTLVAKKSGYAKEAIRSWENGRSSPNLRAVRVWGETLGLELNISIKDGDDVGRT